MTLEFAEAEAPVKAFLGEAYQGAETEWEYVEEQMSALEEILYDNISFGALVSYHVDGVFDRKAHTNRKEAEFIVDLIYQNIDKYPNRSLGVVAFSVAQQDLIDKLLSKRRQSTPEKEYFFKNDGKEAYYAGTFEARELWRSALRAGRIENAQRRYSGCPICFELEV